MSGASAATPELRTLLSGVSLRGSGGTSYQVGRLLGEGGQGWIYEATPEPRGGLPAVIVKVLRPDIATKELRSRFQREAVVLRMLSQGPSPSPHVVRFFDHAEDSVSLPGGHTGHVAFTVLELVSGSTLDRALLEMRGRGLPLGRVRKLLEHMVSGLRAVHAHGVVHRDLKPSNVLLGHEAGHEIAKLTDFGLVRVVSADFARTSKLAGASVGYAPPEQYERGNERVSARTDVFSLAAVVFEMLTGEQAHPYAEGDAPMQVLTRILSGHRPPLRAHPGLAPALSAHPEITAAIEAELHCALAPDPEARHPDVGTFWAALAPLFDRALPSYPHDTAPMRAQPAVASARTVLDEPRFVESEWLFRSTGSRAMLSPWSGAVFGSQSGHVLAVGAHGFDLVSAARIAPQRGPSALDFSTVRGLRRLASGDFCVFGDRGLAGWVSLDLRDFTPFESLGNDLTFTACWTEGAHALLLGRRDGGAAVVANYVRGRIDDVFELADVATPRCGLRTSHGGLLVGTDQGGIVRREAHGAFTRNRIGMADLHAVHRAHDGRLFMVGQGGHALRVGEGAELHLEPVQTTRDLCVLAEAGILWAAGAEGRLLARSPAGWVRASSQPLSQGTAMALYAGHEITEVLWSDGSFTRGSRTAPHA